MKNKILRRMKPLTVLLALTILFSNSIRASGKEHADNKHSNRSYSPLNPGFEFLYEFVLTDKISVLGGSNYIYSMHYHVIAHKYSYKASGHELFFLCSLNIL